MNTEDEALLAEARAWLELDPDPVTKAELSHLVEGERIAEIRERFMSPLEFGTAGLRGVVGAGPSRMNRSIVERATRAVAEYLRDTATDPAALLVVIGRDARPTSSAFSDAAVRVLAGAGVAVRYFEEPCPTPLVAFAARELSATAAIVVTASHNPAEYNGYKLYGNNAVQIVPPVDAEIERRMRSHGTDARAAVSPVEPARVPATVAEEYLARIERERPRGDAKRNISIVYTPLHGVGGALATRALTTAGFTQVAVVPEQAEPDGAFPTARSPNPEEPGTLALALALAERQGAELVLANDPDADRLAVAIRAPGGGYRTLSGNQMGVLLADFVLDHTPPSPRPLLVSSIVSSPMLEELARARGARHETTLTGFKWIWSAALAVEEREAVRFAFGYEEAIGFSVGRAVRDKDGISAAVWFAELAAHAAAEGRTVLERLASLYARYGLWASAQHGVTRRGESGAREIAVSLDRIVAGPPVSLAGVPVTRVVDYRHGGDKRPPWLPDAPLVGLELGDSGRVLLRPSGTEPKLKIYADLRRDLLATESIRDAEAALEARARAAARDLAAHLGFA